MPDGGVTVPAACTALLSAASVASLWIVLALLYWVIEATASV